MKINQKTSDYIKPRLILIGIILFAAYILFRIDTIESFFQSVLDLTKSFIYAVCFAYILNIPMSRIEILLRKLFQGRPRVLKQTRAIATFLTIIFFIILIMILLSIVVPQVVDSIVLLSNNLITYTQNIVNYINNILETINFEDYSIEFNENIVEDFYASLAKNVENIFNSATSLISGISGAVVQNAVAISVEIGTIFLGFMMSLYLLADKETFVYQLKKIIVAILPTRVSKKIIDIGDDANTIFSHFVAGQLVEACIIGLLIYTGMILFGLGKNYEILIGVVVAVTSIIPMFGPTIAMLFGALLILATDPVEAFWFIVFFQVVQQLEGNLIYPRVVGKSVGLPAIWTLLSIVVFGGLFGFGGMIIAVPTTALLYKLVKEFINWCLIQKKHQVSKSAITWSEENE